MRIFGFSKHIEIQTSMFKATFPWNRKKHRASSFLHSIRRIKSIATKLCNKKRKFEVKAVGKDAIQTTRGVVKLTRTRGRAVETTSNDLLYSVHWTHRVKTENETGRLYHALQRNMERPQRLNYSTFRWHTLTSVKKNFESAFGFSGFSVQNSPWYKSIW